MAAAFARQKHECTQRTATTQPGKRRNRANPTKKREREREKWPGKQPRTEMKRAKHASLVRRLQVRQAHSAVQRHHDLVHVVEAAADSRSTRATSVSRSATQSIMLSSRLAKHTRAARTASGRKAWHARRRSPRLNGQHRLRDANLHTPKPAGQESQWHAPQRKRISNTIDDTDLKMVQAAKPSATDRAQKPQRAVERAHRDKAERTCPSRNARSCSISLMFARSSVITSHTLRDEKAAGITDHNKALQQARILRGCGTHLAS
jgi:hypothetical protein